MKRFSTLLLLALIFFTASSAYASETNGAIVTGGNAGYAWSNQAGWVNFGTTNGAIVITDAGITGYAWNSNYGWINMSPANGGITIAANGALSGYAWSSGLGWINFSGVSINSSGKFVGTASGANIGALTFDCANCSVTTDFRAQNFRIVASTPTTVVSGGGGGISFVSGPDGQPIPARISAVNVPMRLYPAQSGILTQGLTNQKSVVLDAPTNVFSDEIIFVIEEEAVSIAPIAEIQVIGNALFNIFAVDKNGNQIQTFKKPIKITFIVPESMRGRSDLAVYFFDETSRTWVKISDTVFSGDSVSFSVDHLTLFAIFAGPALPLVAMPTFSAPIPFEFEIPRSEVEGSSETEEALTGEVPGEAEEISEETSPLFDIEVGPESLESKKIKNFIFSIAVLTLILIAVSIIAIIVGLVIFRKNIKKRTNDFN